MPPTSLIKSFLELPEVTRFNSRRHSDWWNHCQNHLKPHRPYKDLLLTLKELRRHISARISWVPIIFSILSTTTCWIWATMLPHLKLVISFNSLNIHSISKIVLHTHKKEAPNQSATDGKCIKPNILGTSSMATFSMLQNLIMVLNFDHVKRPLDMLL
jgi:hypothetical protein